MKKAEPFHLWTVPGALETTKPNGQRGTLCLSKIHELFCMHWEPLGSSALQDITNIVTSLSLPKESEWCVSRGFLLECSQIESLVLSETPLALSLTKKGSDLARKFELQDVDVDILCQLVDALILNGVAVPTRPDFRFEFYGRARHCFCVQIPMWISVDKKNCQTLNGLWNEAVRVMGEVLRELEESDAVPKDPAFPLDRAAVVVHQMEMAKKEACLKTLDVKLVTAKEWVKGELLDAKGKVKQWQSLKRRLYRAGCESCLIRKLISSVLGMGVVPEKDEIESRRKRHKRWKDKLSEFQKLVKAMNNSPERQTLSDEIKKSVASIQMKVDLSPVETVLNVWAHEHPSVVYGREMTVLVVPFFLVFFSKWSEDGIALDKKGKPMSVEKKEKLASKVYWCLDAFMKLTQLESVWANPEKELAEMSEHVLHVLRVMSPAAAAWLRVHGLNDLKWCFGAARVLFADTFCDVWAVWVRMLCAPIELRRYLVYLVSAVIVDVFEKLVLQSTTVETASTDFCELSKNLDVNSINQNVQWITRNHHF